MSKFDACLTSLSLRDAVPVDALRATAAEYQQQGMEPAAAMQRAVEDQLQLAEMEQRNIVKSVRAAWEAQGGAKPAPAQPAEAATTGVPSATTGASPTTTGAKKEPWQMSGAEWTKARDAVRPNVAQSKFTKASGSEAISNNSRLQELIYGVTDAARERLKAATRKEIKLSRDEVDDLMDRINMPVSHRDVVAKAIAEGKPVPAEVVAEYPDLVAEQSAEPKPAPADTAPAPIQAEQAPGDEIGVAWPDDTEEGQLPPSIAAFVKGQEARSFVSAEDNADGSYSIQESGVEESQRGKGYGVRLYEKLLGELFARGQRVTSDNSVSAEAQRVYKALEKRGYKVTQNPAAYLDNDTGALESTNGPVYTIEPAGTPVAMTAEPSPAPAKKAKPKAPALLARDKKIAQKEAAPKKLKNYSWDAVKLSDAYSFDELKELRQQVETEHKNPLDDKGHPLEGGKPSIHLYDKAGRTKLDKLARAVSYKLADKKRMEQEGELRASMADRRTRTIEVDGVRRPITNSRGQLVAQDFAGQKAFWEFYKDGPVDEQGQPLVMFHGTARDFSEFKSGVGGSGRRADTKGVMFFTTDPRQAEFFAGMENRRSKEGERILPTYVAIQNPLEHDYAGGEKDGEFTASLVEKAKTEGRDGVILRNVRDAMDAPPADVFMAFAPEQIKSAVGNAGTFDASNPDIRAAEAAQPSDMDSQIAQAIKDGITVDKLLALIESESANADNRVLAKALRAQQLQTKIEFGTAQGNYASGNAEQANASYRPATDTAYLHRDGGAENSVLHELVHAATLRALGRGGRAAQQIKALHKHVQNLPSFKGYYGITDPEEFIAEALTSHAFRQQLMDTPAPGVKLSVWQKLVGIVRMVLGLPAAQENVLARVMAIAPDLMAENQARGPISTVELRASMADALAGAANDIAQVRLPANYLVGDLFNQTGKISWWHKTIGTMDNLARRAPAFKTVFDTVQDFIGDVSRYAVSSADLAPTLLPKLENIADIVGQKRKKAVTAADTKAIGAPIFEGTLTWARDANGKPVKVAELEKAAESLTTKQKASILIQKGIIDDEQNQAWLGNPLDFYDGLIAKKYAESELKAGVVWTDAELRDLFSLNRQQIALYHEFRSAINKSLSDLTISEMVKLGGKDAKGMLDKAINAGSLDKAALMLRDHFRDLAAADPDKADMHLDTGTQIMNLADKGQDLIDRGYAPLTRFGKYTVYVEKGGEQLYFGMFESKAEASMMARKMTADNPEASVMHGTVSEEAYKLFAGVSPETIELFGSMVGLDAQADAASTEVYQAYLKLAKNNRSAMKRMIQRKGIAGFSEDAGRVLAGFIYSNARLTSGNAHLGDIDEAVQKIPKQQGELMDAAMQLREHIRNPQQGTALGGLMFAQFLGGSVASAMVNLTQPFTMTFPFLSQYGGAVKSAKRIGEAIKLAGKDSTGDAQLDAALKWAADEGIVAPQEIHYLQNQAQGKAALQSGDGTKAGDTRAALNNTMTKVSLGWGKLFAMAELSNRRITFIAAYKTAVEEGKPNPAKFAQEAVAQTQGTYNSGNKPRWARNPVGGLLMTFKQYGISYLELLSRMAFAGEPGSPERAAGQRAALLMLTVAFLMGGWDGLPFWQDLEDLVDGILQRLGYNFSTKRSKQAFLTNLLGEGGADFALKGVSSLPGMPIDVSGRFGMGNLIPGTGLLTKKDSYARDLGELVGPAGDLAKRAFTGAGKILGGDIAGGALEMAPAAVRNATKGVDMLATGSYQDARGYKVNDTTVAEGVMKAIGFQPNSTADVQNQKGQALNMIAQTRMRSMEISEHWAQGMFEQDPAMIQQARDQMNDWNAKNPETPIRIKLPNILKRVKAMKMDAVNRTQKTAPKALKESVRAELADTRE